MKKYVQCISHGVACWEGDKIIKIWDGDGKETTPNRLEGCHVSILSMHGESLSTAKIISEEEVVFWLLAR